MNDGDVAVAVSPGPGVTGTGLLIRSVPPVQGVGEVGPGKGPHRLKDTVPVGLPPVALPFTVAASVLLVPCTTFFVAGVVVVLVAIPDAKTVSVSD